MRRTAVGAAVLGLSLAAVGLYAPIPSGGAPGTLPACPTEDSLPPGAALCRWDAGTQGNHRGVSFCLVRRAGNADPRLARCPQT